MNWIDLIIIIILAFAIFRGFTEGFVKELASLAALVLGIWGAIKFSAFTAGKLDEWFDMTGQYVGIIAFLVTFGIIVVLINFVGIIVDKIVDAAALSFVNRLLGIAFGLIKTVLILSVIFAVLNAIDARRPILPREKIDESVLFNPISDIAPAIFPVISEGDFRKSFDRLKKIPETLPSAEQDTIPETIGVPI